MSIENPYDDPVGSRMRII